MLRSAHFNAWGGFCDPPFRAPWAAFALAVLVPAAACAQQITCAAGQCAQLISGAARIGSKLRIRTQGPVKLEAGVGSQLTYSSRIEVRARNEAEARRALAGFSVRVQPEGGWDVVTAQGLPATLILKAPRLTAAAIVTTEGWVDAGGIDGFLDVGSIAGSVTADRIRGECRLHTDGGEIRVGTVQGPLQATSGGGAITVRFASGETMLRTVGGDISAQQIGGALHAETMAGSVRVEKAGGDVTAITGGGLIWVGSSGGTVQVRNFAGPVRVGSAANVTCNSGAGRVDLGKVWGTMQVSTNMGNIAALLAGKPAESYLATGYGDITLVIPSNVGVTIQAQNEMADTVRRIVSDFPQLLPRMQGMRVVAEGAVNGGGPVVRLSATTGTIFIKRQ